MQGGGGGYEECPIDAVNDYLLGETTMKTWKAKAIRYKNTPILSFLTRWERNTYGPIIQRIPRYVIWTTRPKLPKKGSNYIIIEGNSYLLKLFIDSLKQFCKINLWLLQEKWYTTFLASKSLKFGTNHV